MKKLLLITTLLIMLMSSCRNETSRFDIPFILQDIEYVKQSSSCQYRGAPQDGVFGGWSKNLVIIAPCGLYQIGDTIKLR